MLQSLRGASFLGHPVYFVKNVRIKYVTAAGSYRVRVIVEGRGLQVEGRKSRVIGRGWESRGRQSKVKGQNLTVCMFLIVLKNEVFWSVLVGQTQKQSSSN